MESCLAAFMNDWSRGGVAARGLGWEEAGCCVSRPEEEEEKDDSV